MIIQPKFHSGKLMILTTCNSRTVEQKCFEKNKNYFLKSSRGYHVDGHGKITLYIQSIAHYIGI